MEKEKIIDVTGIELQPGNPDECRGNGEHVDEHGELIECCCDECDHLALCLKYFELKDKEDSKKYEAQIEHLCNVITAEVRKPDNEQNLELIKNCTVMLDILAPDILTNEELQAQLEKIKSAYKR